MHILFLFFSLSRHKKWKVSASIGFRFPVFGFRLQKPVSGFGFKLFFTNRVLVFGLRFQVQKCFSRIVFRFPVSGSIFFLKRIGFRFKLFFSRIGFYRNIEFLKNFGFYFQKKHIDKWCYNLLVCHVIQCQWWYNIHTKCVHEFMYDNAHTVGTTCC